METRPKPPLMRNRIKLLLTKREAAMLLSISERKLQGLTANGEIPCVRIGRLVRYDPRDLALWIDARKTSSVEVAATEAAATLPHANGRV